MTAVVIRPATPADWPAIADLTERAFGQLDEARLVKDLREGGDVVLELVAERAGKVRGHILFSRLFVEADGARLQAVALAPLTVDPEHQREGIGRALMEEGHARLRTAGEMLSVVLGDPEYYGRAGYRHDRAADFASDYQGAALQALALGDAPANGRLVYASAFSGL